MRDIIIRVRDNPDRHEIETTFESGVTPDCTPKENEWVEKMAPRLLAVLYQGAKAVALGGDGDTMEEMRARARTGADIDDDIREAGA